jgi:hypothetical protein
MYLFVCMCLDLGKVCSKLRENKVIYFIRIYLSVCVLTSVKYVQKYDKTKLYISYVFIVCMCLDLDKICRHVYMFLLYFCKRFYIVWSQCEFQPLRNISATNDHGYVPFVVITIRPFLIQYIFEINLTILFFLYLESFVLRYLHHSLFVVFEVIRLISA